MSRTSCCKTHSLVSTLFSFELTNFLFRTRGVFLWSLEKLCFTFSDLSELSDFERFPM